MPRPDVISDARQHAPEWHHVDDLPQAVVVTTGDGVIIRANRRAERLLGAGPGGLSGSRLGDLVTAESRARLSERLARVSSAPDTPDEPAFAVHLNAGGREQALEVSLGCTRGAFGTLALAALRPLGAGRQAHADDVLTHEHALQLELVTEGAQVGVWKWNPQTNAACFSEQWLAMVGHRPGELPPTFESCRERIHALDLPVCDALMQQHLQGQSSQFEAIHRLRHRDGRWLRVKTRGKVVKRDPAGRPTRVVGAHVDVTSQWEAEVLARQVAQARDAFFASASHDLRSPLNAILGLSEAVLDGVYGTLTEAQERSLRTVHASGRVLLALFNQILLLGRLQAGAVVLERTATPLAPLVSECLSLAHDRADARGQRVEYEPKASAAALVTGDADKLRQALLFLVSNAVDTSPIGATLTIGVTEWPEIGRWELAVTDAAPPIEGPDRDRVFDPYVAVTDASSGRRRLSGLGLALASRIVALHGGTARVEATDGGGNRFVVALPLSRDTAPFHRSEDEGIH